jgi:hypothetical protein
MQSKNFRKYLWIIITVLATIGLGWFAHNAITSGKNMKRLAEIANQICIVQYDNMMENAREENADSDTMAALEQLQDVFCECYTEKVLMDANLYLNMPLGEVLETIVKDEKGVAYACIGELFFAGN